MALYEYIPPDFVENDSDIDTIHERMLEGIPDEFDTSEGSIPWDFTRPTAIEISRLKQFDMNEAIQLIFPQFATGIYLDYHANKKGIVRKAAINATGTLKITGEPGTIIAAGDLFSTESKNGVSSVSYAAVQEYTIPDTGEIDISIVCETAGIEGNTAAGTIILKETDNDGIETVTNENAFNTGADEEEDDALRERVLLLDQTTNISAVGNVSDYKRWASEVNEVGSVNVIPAKDDSGTVTLVITDRNGSPASESICKKVYDHIISPDDESQRKTTINGVNLIVTAPESITITITATVELESTTISSVKTAYVDALKSYFSESIADTEIRYTRICNILGSITGVYDFKDVTLNGGTTNITLPQDNYASITENDITLVEGGV